MPDEQNPAPPPENGGRREAHWLHQIPENALLPAVCPLCAAPGVHPQSVAQEKGCTAPPLQAHYCDICAEAQQDAQTRRLAVTLACSLFSFAAATALTLFYGLRLWGVQFLAVLLFSCTLPLLAAYFRIWQRDEPVTRELTSSQAARRLTTSSSVFSQALTRAGWKPGSIVNSPSSGFATFTSAWPLWGVALAATFWWSALQLWGTTQIRVIYGGSGSATLLVDGRHAGTVQASHSEDPLAGRRLRVLAGRRELRLISSRGEILVEQSTTLWPQHSYLLALPPPGKCLFSEAKTYGEEGQTHFMNYLPGDGPLWELEGTIDAWFEGLGAEDDDFSELSPDQENFSGGKRRAIRLLPCRR